MKYNSSSTLKSLYAFKPLEYIKTLLLTNIKTCYTNPRNSLYYSIRYNSGERFMLDNKLLFPYQISIKNPEQENHPNFVAFKLDNNIKELEIHNLEYELTNKNMIPDLKLKEIEQSMTKNLTNIYKYFKYVKEEDFNLSAFTIARVVYCITNYNKLIRFVGSNTKSDNTKTISGGFNNEDIKYLIDYFAKNKINYTDSESLALVLSCITEYKEDESLNNMFKKISDVKFENEFTKVKNISPHLFKYTESSNSKLFKIFNNIKTPYFNYTLNEFTNSVYVLENRDMFITYNVLKKASSLNNEANIALTKFNDKFNLNENSILRRNFDKLSLL